MIQQLCTFLATLVGQPKLIFEKLFGCHFEIGFETYRKEIDIYHDVKTNQIKCRIDIDTIYIQSQLMAAKIQDQLQN